MSSDVEVLSPAERLEAVKRQLVKVFGEEAAQVLDYRDTAWSQEQFTSSKTGHIAAHFGGCGYI